MAVRSPSVQTWVAQKIARLVSNKTGVEISLKHVDIDFFNRLYIDSLLVHDIHQDTLAFVESAELYMDYFSLFKRELNIRSIQIHEPDIFISRKDSVWNTPTASPKDTSKSNASIFDKWKLLVHEVVVHDGQCIYQDHLGGVYLDFSASNLAATMQKPLGEEYAFSEISMYKPLLHIQTDPSKKDTSVVSNFQLPFQIPISSDEIQIEALTVSIQEQQAIKTNRFNSKDILIDEGHIAIHQFAANKDTLQMTIDSLHAHEQCGFSIQDLYGKMIVTNTSVELDSFILQTNHSLFGQYIRMDFPEMSSLVKNPDELLIQAVFNQTKINKKDVDYFVDVPGLSKEDIEISGNIYGTLGNIRGKELILKAGKHSVFDGSVSLMGLPNIEETYIGIKLNSLQTSYYDLKRIYADIPLPKNIKELGIINFSGRFDGFVSDFVAYGTFHTLLGSVYTDVNFKLQEQKEALYSGKVKMNSFDAGKWFHLDPQLGKLSIEVDVKGKGIDLQTLNATLIGNVSSISINDYMYQNITVDGTFQDQFFTGKVDMNDENLQFDFEGLINAQHSVPVFDFSAHVDHANLKALHLTNDSTILRGAFSSNFSASSIDDIVGQFYVDSLIATRNNNTYILERASLKAEKTANNKRKILIESDQLDATFQGDFLLSYIPKSIKQMILSNQSEADTLFNQTLAFDIEIKEENSLLSYFIPDYTLSGNTWISGNMNTVKNQLLLKLVNDEWKYKEYKAKDTECSLILNNGKIQGTAYIDKIFSLDSVLLQESYVNLNGVLDDVRVDFGTASPKKDYLLDISANVFNHEDLSTRIHMNPSTIIVEDKYWSIDSNNLFTIQDDFLIIDQFAITHNGEKISANTVLIEDTTYQATINLSNVNLDHFSSFIQKENIQLSGLLNGNIEIINPLRSPLIYGNILASKMKVNEYDVGDMNLSANYDVKSKEVHLDGSLIGDENDIDIHGSYKVGTEITKEDIDIHFDVTHFAISSIEDFIPDYIDKTKGTVTGELRLIGPRNAPDLLGYLDINDVTTTVTFLQTEYNVRNERVHFEPEGFNLGQVLVRDVDGNIGIGKGWVYHDHFKDFALDISVFSNKIQGLNTTQDDNEVFYGTAYLNGGVTFEGPTNQINIHVFGSTEENTLINVPVSESTSNAQGNTFYVFINKDDQKEDTEESTIKVKGVDVTLDLDINQNAEVNLILDNQAGDVLNAKGEGNLKIDVQQGGESVDFFGTYVISDGSYLFTLKSFINKRFRLEPGSTIQFNGELSEAQLNVNAIYTVRSSMYNLIQEYINDDESVEKSSADNRLPIDLFLKLTGPISYPNVGFDILVQQVDPLIRSYVETKLQAIRNYPNELNRQVFGLLVLNQFLPTNTGLESNVTSTNVIGGSATNTVSEFVSNQLSNYFNDWLSYIGSDLNLDFNYQSYDQASEVNELTTLRRRELQLALTQRFLNDRISISVGGNVDFGQDITQENSSSAFFGGDFTFEYAITKDRRLRAKAFTITDYDYFYQNNRTRAGLGLSYRREYDTLKEFFGIKKKEKKKETEED